MRLSPTCAMNPFGPRTRSRPHAAFRRVRLRFLVDLRAGALHRVLEERDDVFGRDLRRAARAPEVILEQLLLALELLVHGAHRHRAGDLAGGVAPHAVGHDEERELLVDEEVVLVVVAHFADVRRGEEADRVRHEARIMPWVPWS
jgi:hypothetical protein